VLNLTFPIPFHFLYKEVESYLEEKKRNFNEQVQKKRVLYSVEKERLLLNKRCAMARSKKVSTAQPLLLSVVDVTIGMRRGEILALHWRTFLLNREHCMCVVLWLMMMTVVTLRVNRKLLEVDALSYFLFCD